MPGLIIVTLALRCLFVIGLGAVVATDCAKVIAVLPSTIVVSELPGDSGVVVPGVVVVLELSGTSVDVFWSFLVVSELLGVFGISGAVLLSCSVLTGVKTHLILWSVTP